MAAVKSGRSEVIQMLLASGAAINTKDKQYGATPLIWAVQAGSPDAVKLLLANGAEVNVKDNDGKTALSYARSGNKPDIEALLTKAGASPAKEEPRKEQPADKGKSKEKPAPKPKAGKKS